MAFNPGKYVRTNVTRDDVIQIKNSFDSLDLDGSGSISPLEIRAFFQRVKLVDSKEDVYNMLKEMDDDYSGGVDFEEFLTFITSCYGDKSKRDELRKLLKLGVDLSPRLARASNFDAKAQTALNKPEASQKQGSASAGSKPQAKENKKETAPVSREKAKKTELRSKPKSSGQKSGSSQKNEGEFDPEPYVNVQTSRETVLDLKKAFDLLDADSSGFISPAEIQQYFESMGLLSKNRLAYQILNEMDPDDSGQIDFVEFMNFMSARINDKSPNLRAEIEKIFKFFDTNGNGKVSWEELKVVSQFLGEEMTDDEIREMFVKADLDDDGFVNADDFYNIWTGKGYY